jgi:hypothetical protein
MMDARVAGDEVIACFSCGRGMTYCGPRADGSSGRFCTDRCRDYFDAGGPRYEGPPGTVELLRQFPVSPAILGQGGRGAVIECPGCRKRESLGLRYCSPACRDRAHERARNLVDMGPLDPEDTHRKCETCGARLPRWRNGVRVSKTKRFCSPQWRQKAWRQGLVPEPGSVTRSGEKTPENKGFVLACRATEEGRHDEAV